MTAETPENKVYIRQCEDYDRERIQSIIAAGIAALNYAPAGNLFVKPNVVFATKNGKHGATAYTHPAVLGAASTALASISAVKRLDIGEKTAIGYPTRLVFKYADYYAELRRTRKLTTKPVRLFCIDEQKRDRVFVGGKIHDNLRVPRSLARADGKIYLPKLKCHCVSTMTGAVKLNIGICSDDERAIRHDFLLNDKIVDLLAVGMPDLVIMDAIEVGVGNEAFPTPRKLGLIIIGTNPMAVDLVGARLLGYSIDDVPYLKRAAERGYGPEDINDIRLSGDISSLTDLDAAAARILPHDAEYVRWQDIHTELDRLHSPIRFYWGPARQNDSEKCGTGCVMGAKMFFGFLERYAGAAAFRNAKPVVMVIGKIDEQIDARGQEAFLIGSCSAAPIINAKKIIKIDNCFTTAVDLAQRIRGRLGIPAPIMDPAEVMPLAGAMLSASFRKLINQRYFQDIGHFLTRGLQKRI